MWKAVVSYFSGGRQLCCPWVRERPDPGDRIIILFPGALCARSGQSGAQLFFRRDGYVLMLTSTGVRSSSPMSPTFSLPFSHFFSLIPAGGYFFGCHLGLKINKKKFYFSNLGFKVLNLLYMGLSFVKVFLIVHWL